MHSFGLTVNDFGHIGDVFAKAAAISATSVKEMMEAMKQASAISNMFGVSMEGSCCLTCYTSLTVVLKDQSEWYSSY